MRLITCIVGIKSRVHYYAYEHPCNCAYFGYFGYDEEIPSNSHLYMYRKHCQEKQKWLAEEDSYSAPTFTDRNGDDDAVATDDDDDSCGFNSAVIALYDPCTINNVIGLDTQAISQLQIWPSFLRTSHRGYYYAPLWKYTINRR